MSLLFMQIPSFNSVDTVATGHGRRYFLHFLRTAFFAKLEECLVATKTFPFSSLECREGSYWAHPSALLCVPYRY